jgi:DNA-binding CsgD family transcriptional regulator
MARLTRADMEAALAFAAEVGTAASEPDRADDLILERVARHLLSELTGYDLFDADCRLLHSAEFSETPIWVPTEHEWELLRTQNPFTNYAERASDPLFHARRLSDVVDMELFKQTELYAVHDDDIDYAIQARMPGPDGGHWTLEVGRAGRDYSPGDLLFVDAIRPALVGYEAHRALAATVAALQGMSRDAVPDELLSVRENEVLDLVASGATNAQIAERLWISPATVKKHLENVYAKLEVGSRTAALAHTGRSLAAGSSSAPAH